MKLTTRKISINDYKEFFTLSDSFLSESPLFSTIPDKNPEELMRFFVLLTDFPDEFFGVFGYQDDLLAGMMIGRRVPFYFADSNYVHDIMFYIKPVVRGGLLVRKFTRELDKWAFSDPQCVLVQLTALASGDNDRTSELAVALGYDLAGHFMIKKR